ncbi:hypothetical protein PANT_27c00071 [Moesziomyces antarcticus T-34]|uniref:Uncharacterized protein n=1 Tax=Pseudozyma antarctica (strain T-34) TaxID=1151754 RepID=M9MJ92_PSEA3|nr:hypothetical protein PANT_27c00071 [Moesziomyces antarcticus T-34]
MEGHAATSARLLAMGSLTIRDYLKTALPQQDMLDIVPTPPAAAAKPAPPPPQHGQDEEKAEVPFYIKRRGKGKGRPVMYNWFHSSVAQIYVTVEFDDMQATSPGDAGSIKEAKEQACMVLAARILARNARRITH